ARHNMGQRVAGGQSEERRLDEPADAVRDSEADYESEDDQPERFTPHIYGSWSGSRPAAGADRSLRSVERRGTTSIHGQVVGLRENLEVKAAEDRGRHRAVSSVDCKEHGGAAAVFGVAGVVANQDLTVHGYGSARGDRIVRHLESHQSRRRRRAQRSADSINTVANLRDCDQLNAVSSWLEVGDESGGRGPVLDSDTGMSRLRPAERRQLPAPAEGPLLLPRRQALVERSLIRGEIAHGRDCAARKTAYGALRQLASNAESGQLRRVAPREINDPLRRVERRQPVPQPPSPHGRSHESGCPAREHEAPRAA